MLSAVTNRLKLGTAADTLLAHNLEILELGSCFRSLVGFLLISNLRSVFKLAILLFLATPNVCFLEVSWSGDEIIAVYCNIQ